MPATARAELRAARRRDVGSGHEMPAGLAGDRRRREPGGAGGRAAAERVPGAGSIPAALPHGSLAPLGAGASYPTDKTGKPRSLPALLPPSLPEGDSGAPAPRRLVKYVPEAAPAAAAGMPAHRG